MTDGQGQSVRRRRVFYIPGYDPIHPRRYRELYRSEGAAQARISGYEIGLVGRQGGATYGWQVDGAIEGGEVEAEFDVLVWSDIVRTSMELNIPQTYLLMARTAWTYIGSGALWRLMRLRKGPVMAALYPVGMLILQLVVALLAGWIVGGVLKWAVVAVVPGVLPHLVFWLALVAVLVAVLRAFRRYDNKLFVYYLMHDYAYSARSRGANPPELEARIAALEAKLDN